MPSSPSDDELLALARQAAARAYSPYSKARVGCALLTTTGTVFTGCNVENASFGLTMCAERVALGAAVAAEGAGMRWTRAAVMAEGLEFPPCGACRQVLAELAADGARVIFIDQGTPVSLPMRDLLPAAFDGGRLP